MAFEVSNSILRDTIARLGYPEPEPGVCHIWGARGAVPYLGGTPDDPLMLTLKENVIDSYNDTVGVFGTAFGIWKGTVDPGLPYTLDPLNSQGCAHLNDGVWLYQVGSHKGHEALVQADEVTVTRDEDRDGTGELSEYQDTGWFGIDGHCMTGAHVDDWSAGCWGPWSQSCWNGPEWQEFLSTVKYNPGALSGGKVWRFYLFPATAFDY